MLAQAVAQFFNFKVVTSIFVLTTEWKLSDKVIFSRQLSQYGISATFTSDPMNIVQKDHLRFQGIFYVRHGNDTLLEQVKPEYFSLLYKWLVIADELPNCLEKVRYDVDIALLKWKDDNEEINLGTVAKTQVNHASIEDIYVHPRDGISLHPWAIWTVQDGFQLTNERERVLRRLDLKQYPLKIATAKGAYSSDWYKGTFRDYLNDESLPELDSSSRIAYISSSTILQFVKASEILEQTAHYVPVKNDNGSSMIEQVVSGSSDIAGNLRILLDRLHLVDYIMPNWPLRMGFIYLAERKSSSSMFIEPFKPDVWWSCLGLVIILAFAQRITAKSQHEKEGAFMAVLATSLQQDADAVPKGVSGRWSFMVLSISSMIVYAYYTSAIVSALMSTGTGGPTTLRALGDSNYEIASGDYDYMKQLWFEAKTNNSGLEYLKKKKKGPNFYQNLETGIMLVKSGKTAYHAEYNLFYPYLKSLSDDQLCKLSSVDTVPGIMTWVVTSKGNQWMPIFRAKGVRLMEVGIRKRIFSKISIKPPECRSALMVEQVTFGDVASLLLLTFLGGLLACCVLAAEIAMGRIKKNKDEDALEVLDYVE